MNRLIGRVVFAALALSFSFGCDVQQSTLDSLGAIAQPVRATGRLEGFDIDAGRSPIGEQESSTFEPPYPQRENPFSFPTSGQSQLSSTNTVNSVTQIQILGFANVEEPRVFLRSRSITKSLAVGEQVDGVEVVSINPPAAELRMGTLVWTVTMFDKSQ